MNRRHWSFVLVVVTVLLTLVCGTADAEAKAKTKKRHSTSHRRHSVVVRKPPAYADLVIEANTGRVLHAVNPDATRHPASLTKMMTLYLAFQALESGRLRVDQQLPVSSHAAAQSPSKLGLRVGQTIEVSDALLSIVTHSANDAAVVVAEALGGSESQFAQMMTRQARALGMRRTAFYNASGLPNPKQVTTARDMAALGHALVYHYPRSYALFSRDSFTYNGVNRPNHNHLMERYDGMDGIKTGYVAASGFNLVASAVRGKTRLIGVVFGGRSPVARDNQMAQLLDEGFQMASSNTYFQAQADGEGDSRVEADSHYVALPAKVAAIFPPRSAGGREVALNKLNDMEPAGGGAATPTDWGIQVGAYGDAATGQQVLVNLSRRMTPLLSHSSPIVLKSTGENGTTIYRARFMGMERATARSICTYMVKNGHGCLLVTPDRQAGS